jgi:type I restriction enzyme M protein
MPQLNAMSSVDLPVEPFKVSMKEYGRTPALPNLLVLRHRNQEELINTEHPAYKVFMAVVDRAGVDTRGTLFQRALDGDVLIFENEIIERIRNGGEIEIRHTIRRSPRVHDQLPLVAEKFKEFLATGEVAL